MPWRQLSITAIVTLQDNGLSLTKRKKYFLTSFQIKETKDNGTLIKCKNVNNLHLQPVERYLKSCMGKKVF